MTEAMTRDEIEAQHNEHLAYDPDADAGISTDLSGLDQIKKDLGNVVAKPSMFRHPNPQLAQWTMAFRTVIAAQEAEAIDKRTQHSKQQVRDRTSQFIASTCIGLYRDGEQQLDGDGKPLRFAHPGLMATLGAKTAAGAVVEFFARNDGHMAGIADRVAKAAGYGVDVEETDPTLPA